MTEPMNSTFDGDKTEDERLDDLLDRANKEVIRALNEQIDTEARLRDLYREAGIQPGRTDKAV